MEVRFRPRFSFPMVGNMKVSTMYGLSMLVFSSWHPLVAFLLIEHRIREINNTEFFFWSLKLLGNGYTQVA
jgi:hypothetical protein